MEIYERFYYAMRWLSFLLFRRACLPGCMLLNCLRDGNGPRCAFVIALVQVCGYFLYEVRKAVFCIPKCMKWKARQQLQFLWPFHRKNHEGRTISTLRSFEK